MLAVPWPCDTCGAPGIRNVGSRGYCGVHLTELYRKFAPEVFVMNGVGLQAGPMRPDWGPTFADLQCCACGAGWTGPIGESCWWCRRAHGVMLEHSARLVLVPPDIDVDHPAYDTVMKAWAERLARSVKAGLVDRHVADAAWRRTVRRSAA